MFFSTLLHLVTMSKLWVVLLCSFLIATGNQLFAQPLPAATPIGMVKDSFFTNMGNRIYKMGRVGAEWFYAFDLPFTVEKEDNLSMPDAEHILEIKKDTNFYYYNFVSQKIVVTTSRQLIQKFCSAPIKKIIFHKGVAGCFAFSNIEEQYSRGEWLFYF